MKHKTRKKYLLKLLRNGEGNFWQQSLLRKEFLTVISIQTKKMFCAKTCQSLHNSTGNGGEGHEINTLWHTHHYQRNKHTTLQ